MRQQIVKRRVGRHTVGFDVDQQSDSRAVLVNSSLIRVGASLQWLKIQFFQRAFF